MNAICSLEFTLHNTDVWFSRIFRKYELKAKQKVVNPKQHTFKKKLLPMYLDRELPCATKLLQQLYVCSNKAKLTVHVSILYLFEIIK